MLKKISIKTSAFSRAEFVYMFFGDRCVFTATGSANNGSSINWAETIALMIANQENRVVSDVRFFDLQTPFSYGKVCSQENVFAFDQIRLIPANNSLGWHADAWHSAKCPRDVLNAFQLYVPSHVTQLQLQMYDAEF